MDDFIWNRGNQIVSFWHFLTYPDLENACALVMEHVFKNCTPESFLLYFMAVKEGRDFSGQLHLKG